MKTYLKLDKIKSTMVATKSSFLFLLIAIMAMPSLSYAIPGDRLPSVNPQSGLLVKIQSSAPGQRQNTSSTAEASPQKPDDDQLPAIDQGSEPDVFYDSMPARRGVQPTVPEKADPVSRPAGKIIRVIKDFDKEDDRSLLVSAQRAVDLGRYDSALSLYDQLYKKNPRDPRILMGRAVALQKAGHVQNAIKMYEELLDVRPNHLEAEVSMLGLVRTRFPAMALKSLTALFKDHPNNAALSAEIGLAYADLGNIEDSLRHLGMAVSLEPNQAIYYYNMAVVSDRVNANKEAIRYYEEALSKDAIYGGKRSIPRELVYDRLAVLRQR